MKLNKNKNKRSQFVLGAASVSVGLVLASATYASTVSKYQSVKIENLSAVTVNKSTLVETHTNHVTKQRKIKAGAKTQSKAVGQELYLAMEKSKATTTAVAIRKSTATQKSSAIQKQNISKTRLTAKQKENINRLKSKARGKGGVKLLFEKSNAVPTYIKPLGASFKSNSLYKASNSISKASNRLSIAKSFLRENQDLLKISNSDAELVLVKQESDKLNMTHLSFQQKINGVPIWGKESLVHLDKNDNVYLYQGRTEPTAQKLNTTPKLTADESLEKVLSALNHSGALYAPAEKELVVYIDDDNEPKLAYKVELSPTLDTNWIYFVDAQTGNVIHKINNIQTNVVSASGVDLNGVNRGFNAWLNASDSKYYLIDPSTPTVEQNPDPVVDGPQSKGDTFLFDVQNTEGSTIALNENSTDDNWQDPVAVSAAYNNKVVYDYYLNTFNRNSIDGNGMNLISYIHYGQDYDNAYWNGSSMIFGDGGSLFSPLAGCLDVAAHEMSHGIIQNTANLIYENQSGALNESFADVFSAMVDRDDWKVGEDCTTANPGYLRDMANPSSGLSVQPKHMDEYRDLPNTEDGDNGGVHINSGIPNRAAYLISEGLTDENIGTSIGRADTEQIYYRALTTYLKSSSQFIDARRALIQAADDLFSQGSTQSIAIVTAFDAVGIVEGSDVDNTPTPTDPISGDDVMVYLYPSDGIHDSVSEDYQLYTQVMASPFAGYVPASDIGPYNAAADDDLPLLYTKPAAFTDQDGTYLYYIANDHNVYAAVSAAKDVQLTTSGDFSSFAISPNGRYLAYTTTSGIDNNLYLIDFENEGVVSTHPIFPEDYQEDGGVSNSSILYADSLSFDYTSNLIVFDALNCLSIPNSDCSTGAGYRFWSIGVFEASTSQFVFPIANQSPDINVGFPSFATNNNFVVTMDIIDKTNFADTGLVESSTVAIDFESQATKLLYSSGQSASGFWSVPTFWGDDDFVSMQLPATGTQVGNISASRIAVNADWTSSGVTEPVNIRDVAMPIMHRIGARILTGALTPSTNTLNFGDVEVGQTKQLSFTLSNTGNSDIEITSVTSDVISFNNNGYNTRIPREQTLTVQVNYTPTQTGTETDELIFENNGTGGNVVISLTATGADTTSPVITPPADISVSAASSSGTPSTDATITTFLDGATATDNIDSIVVTNNAPSTFPAGETTTVIFTASDTAGNSSTATATVTVGTFTAPVVAKSSGGGGGSFGRLEVILLFPLLIFGLIRKFRKSDN